MPTGVLPKMIACSPDNNYIAITHWGDNTIGMIDISSSDYNDFNYISHFVVVKQLDLNFDSSEKIDRDSDCGFCLRGTVFSPDSKYLFVGRMGGGGMAVFDVAQRKYLRTIWGMHYNLRHLEVNNGYLYIGTNTTGFVDRAKLSDLYTFIENTKDTQFAGWESCYAGKGVRTIKVSADGQYVFAAVNNENKIAVVRTNDMKVIAEIGADSFPVGMDLAWDEKILIVSSQGKSKLGGGHSVMVYKISLQ
jgi:DNA-binding beta-propeller fold protein YncE